MALAVAKLLQWFNSFVLGAPGDRPGLNKAEYSDWKAHGFEKATPTAAGFCPTRLSRLSDYLNAQVAERRVAGLQFAIIKDGKLCYYHDAGHACVEEGRLMQHDTLFRIYSMTKPITSAAVMMLYEQGLIQLDDPIHNYIPSFTTMHVATERDAQGTLLTNPAEAPITIHQLLTHTSGLSYW